MNIGDLVQILPQDDGVPRNGKETGVILEFGTHHPDSTATIISIIKVFWNTGTTGWIATERVIVIDHPET